ncbi:hypothetical protein A1O7_03648 [Cladophialophora yegresii CBS 114405]|uniref:Heterokaryon incompatibility domain-containing protein n=1 Tax=Cladophialophora yegresii CBS 114405 TaxID=1182544 RepID=W9WF50_9EURO|nr:uncharacterized protein A1O7_03648 [Cladophialophora yegresii CBS 114405]EXJ63201.1 hypothetical protein A1O7_03648 [Cladophialophora yegresii CBS 114405]
MPNRCFEIPFLSSSDSSDGPYDNQIFSTYIDRKPSWTVDDILSPKQSSHSQTALADTIQTWLFFGLIHEAFGHHARQRDFIDVDPSGQALVTTAPLWRLCYDTFLSSAHPEASSRSHELEKSIALAAEFVGRIHLGLQDIDEELEKVLFSVMILCDALQLSINPSTSVLPSRQWPLSDVLLENHMRLVGWCPSDMQKVTKMLDLHSLTLASKIPPRDPGSHDRCDSVRCYANDVVSGEYLRKHHNCNGCEEFVADPVEICDILDDGHLPLIDPSQGNGPKLRLKSTGEAPKYIAISHVWSDGLGNPHRNAIYRCQLSRLQDLACCLSQPALPLWLDTISCPRDYEHIRERARKAYGQAIAFMRRTYRDAETVLVLDHSLLDVDSKNLTHLGILLRFVTCGWTRRLWTYQEGILARKLLVQFADRAVDIDEVYSRWQDSSKAIFYPSIRGAYKELRILLDSGDDDYTEKILHRVSRPLQFRKTSVASDEALCLSTLANLSPERVKRVSESEKNKRMETFYSNLPTISKQIIFWHGDRLQQIGFRWAPASFLNNSNLYFRDWDHGPSAECNKAMLSCSGLSFDCPGILLGKLSGGIQSFLVTTGPDTWYHVSCRQFDGQEGVPFRIVPDHNMPDISLALLNPTSFQEDFSTPGFETRVSLIVAIVAEEDGTLIAQTLCPAFVFRKVGIGAELPLVMKTYQFFRKCLQDPDTPERDCDSDSELDVENASLLEDESLVGQYQARGRAAVLEHVQRPVSAQGENLLWAGTTMLNGRLSLVREGMHSIFEGSEIASRQRWCLD